MAAALRREEEEEEQAKRVMATPRMAYEGRSYVRPAYEGRAYEGHSTTADDWPAVQTGEAAGGGDETSSKRAG